MKKMIAAASSTYEWRSETRKYAAETKAGDCAEDQAMRDHDARQPYYGGGGGGGGGGGC